MRVPHSQRDLASAKLKKPDGISRPDPLSTEIPTTTPLTFVGSVAAALCLCAALTGRGTEIRAPEAPFTDGRALSVEVPEARIEQDAVVAGTKRLQINSQLLRLAFEIENEQTWMMHVSSVPGLLSADRSSARQGRLPD